MLALLLSSLVAGLGWWLRLLTPGGALAASLVGTAIIGGTGVPGLLALGSFFVGSSLVSRIAPDLTSRFDGKTTRRDAAQVIANGGAAALGALLPGAAIWAVTASLAAAAADTWATSVGGWSRSAPRHILRGHPVPAGTSGGVTLLGTVGALVGAAIVGFTVALGAHRLALFPLALGVGMLGMLLDSVLGAAVQGRFHCDACDLPTEGAVHRCGRQARPTGGTAWITNDVVNGIATLAAAVAGWAAWYCWGR